MESFQEKLAIAKKDVKKPKTAERAVKSLKEKYQSIANLFLFIVVFIVLLISAGFHYGVLGIGQKTIIINPVEAKVINKEVKTEKIEVVEDPTCYNQIAKYSEKHNADADLAKRIIDKESGGKATAKNKTSTASGCFQFVNATWHRYGQELWGEEFYEKNIYNPEHNVELGAYVLGKYGSNDWNASGF